MASSLSTTASASMVTKSAGILPHYNTYRLSTLSFRLSPKPKLRFLAKGLQPTRNGTALVKAQLNEVAVDGSSNAATSTPAKSKVPLQEAKDAKPSNEPSPPSFATEESISEFISQVSSLVKLVDSRDIVELQLKQHDCELLIRKKEPLPLPPSHSPVVMMHSPPPPPPPVMPAATPAASAAASSPSPSAVSSSPPSKSAKPSHPPVMPAATPAASAAASSPTFTNGSSPGAGLL